MSPLLRRASRRQGGKAGRHQKQAVYEIQRAAEISQEGDGNQIGPDRGHGDGQEDRVDIADHQKARPEDENKRDDKGGPGELHGFDHRGHGAGPGEGGGGNPGKTQAKWSDMDCRVKPTAVRFNNFGCRSVRTGQRFIENLSSRLALCLVGMTTVVGETGCDGGKHRLCLCSPKKLNPVELSGLPPLQIHNKI